MYFWIFDLNDFEKKINLKFFSRIKKIGNMYQWYWIDYFFGYLH